MHRSQAKGRGEDTSKFPTTSRMAGHAAMQRKAVREYKLCGVGAGSGGASGGPEFLLKFCRCLARTVLAVPRKDLSSYSSSAGASRGFLAVPRKDLSSYSSSAGALRENSIDTAWHLVESAVKQRCVRTCSGGVSEELRFSLKFCRRGARTALTQFKDRASVTSA